MNSIYRGILGGLIIFLGIGYWSTSSSLENLTDEYNKLQFEKELSDLQKESFKVSIGMQNDKIKALGVLAEQHQEVIVKESVRIDLKYKDRYIQVYDLNKTEECRTFERIIDEEFNINNLTTI